ncbi:MAG: methyltransferase domain-containing protein [Syntrophales bacterium]|nr:methyltransferase domain-containing protein [Syntrophales bacterium]
MKILFYKRKYFLRRSLAALVILAVVGLFVVGLERLQFDSNILASLPQDDPVLADAHYIFTHHPIYDRVVVDVAGGGGKTNVLEAGADLVETRMRESGLFKDVGFRQISRLVPELMRHVVDHLPILFGAGELKREILPLLAPERIRRNLDEQYSSLRDLGGIGQAGFLAVDPLSLRNLVLARLSSLAPAKNARIQNGKLLSTDGKHILIVAEPITSGMDTRQAARIAALLESISRELDGKYGGKGGFTLTPVGAYRAALDNETSAKGTVKKAVLFSTVAIALLLFAGFPRPLIGLLSLLPAFAGTMMAYFVYSLFHATISLMAVGFGGAIISFTVDYGITYLLFLDRPYETRGLEATKEVWSLGLLAMLTTAVSFAFLSLSGFPVLAEIGQFAALGVVFTYIFVHLVFPLIFPVLPPAKRPPYLPLMRFVKRIASAGGKGKTYAALVFMIIMLFFAKPEFNVDLNSMNAMSPQTLRADKLIREVWGDVMSKVHLLVEGRDRQDMQVKCDRLTKLLNEEAAAGRVSQFFVSSLIFPGEEEARKNAAAWQNFWSPERIADLRQVMGDASRQVGFATGAFASFFTLLQSMDIPATDLPERYAPLLGIKAGQNGGAWTQVVSVTPGPSYEGEDFYRRLTATGLVRVFDPALFTKRLGALLLSAFVKMVGIVALVTLLTAFFYFLDWRLTLLGLAPTLFAMICTLGTLNLLGEPLGIPTLMVSVVVIGMGTDYALYLVRSYQRYLDDDDPSLGLVRLSVFLSFATTFMGFCILAISDNAMLKSAGLSLALGIGYSFLGAVTIVPPLVKRIFVTAAPAEETILPGSKRHLERAVGRYRHLETYPRLFARFKILLDPMFPRLADFVKDPGVVIDIGTGYGVPAVWLLELYPRARIYGLEPDRERVRFASRAIGTRGVVTVGGAPDLPEVPVKADTALILDMIHLLTDEELRLTLRRLHERLLPDGALIIRATVPSTMPFPWKRWIERQRIKLHKGRMHFRTEEDLLSVLVESGFPIIRTEAGAPGQEEKWFIARLEEAPGREVIQLLPPAGEDA